ncbi:dehydrogenase/reductase SDR family member 11-like [Onthophagus taurus]|uniref:dehydrogenase/reductase SDR family member 11-like n=1 Tax=Onthophagus taurus TaxID=166361 RepID=UPI0039BE155A
MNLENKVAIVTGASGGIGQEIVKSLLKIGMQVVGLGRQTDQIESLDDGSGNLHALKVDINNEEEIMEAFSWISSNLGAIYVLVNNAGVMPPSGILEGKSENWKSIMDVNVVAVAVCAREAINNMKVYDVEGHIVNIGSTLGNYSSHLEDVTLYAASKFAVGALTENLRLELIRAGTKIRVTTVSPGLVQTTLIHSYKSNVPAEEIDEFVNSVPHLKPEDVANVVTFVITQPQHLQICEVIMRATGEATP